MRKLNHFLRTLFIATSFAIFFAPTVNADILLKQSTASQAVKFGPFVDSTDGNTEETALTIANTDIKCSKNGGTLASKSSGGGTHDANGWYTVTFDATDTNTVGRFQCFVHVAGALPVTFEANIVEEAIYDGLYGASAGTSTTILPVNTTQLAGTTQTGRDIGASVLLSNGTGTGQISFTAGIANVNVAQVSTDATAADTFETWLDGTAGSAMPIGIVDQGTAQSATGTTLVLRSALAIADDAANGMTLVACGTTQGYCQSRGITDYVSSTDTATVDTWTVTPSGTITYYLFGTAPASGGTAPSAATVADAVWDEARSGHVTAGSFGEYVPANVTTYGGTAGTFTSGQPTVRISNGTGTGQVSLSSGTVTAGTVSDKTGYALSAAGVDAVWDEAQAGHATAGTFGLYLDAAISGVSTGGVSAATIADAVWDEATSGHTTAGTTGERLTRVPNAAAGASGGLPTVDANNAVKLQTGTGANQIALTSGAVTVGTNNDKTGYALSAAGLNGIRDIVVDDISGLTLGCVQAALAAYAGGNITTAGGTSTYKDQTGAEIRISGPTISNGNRTATITCPTYP